MSNCWMLSSRRNSVAVIKYGVSIGSVIRRNTNQPGTPSSLCGLERLRRQADRSPASSSTIMNGV